MVRHWRIPSVSAQSPTPDNVSGTFVAGLRRWFMRGWMRGALGVVAVGLFWMAVAYAVMPSSQERPPPLEVSIELLPRLRPTPGVAVFMTLRGRALAGVRSLAMAPAKGPDRGIDG